MHFLLIASVMLATITNLSVSGPVILYASDLSIPPDPPKPAVCLQCNCEVDQCPDLCGCKLLPAKPNTITAPAGPNQHCTGTQQEMEAGYLCPWACKDGTCLCYDYCSRNYCPVYGPGNTVYLFANCAVSVSCFSLSCHD